MTTPSHEEPTPHSSLPFSVKRMEELEDLDVDYTLEGIKEGARLIRESEKNNPPKKAATQELSPLGQQYRAALKERKPNTYKEMKAEGTLDRHVLSVQEHIYLTLHQLTDSGYNYEEALEIVTHDFLSP